MQKITIKEYAIKHKLSIFNVMKMVKSGKVKSESMQEDGREVIYILYDEESETNISNQIVKHGANIDEKYEGSLKLLQKEVRLLRKELDELKNKVLK